MTTIVIPLVFPVVALIFSFWLVRWILKKDQGTEEMKKVSAAIHEGATAFMKRQYKTISTIGLVVALGLWAIYYFTGKAEIGLHTAIAFAFGAASSAISGVIGMSIAVRSNSRSAAGSKTSFKVPGPLTFISVAAQ